MPTENWRWCSLHQVFHYAMPCHKCAEQNAARAAMLDEPAEIGDVPTEPRFRRDAFAITEAQCLDAATVGDTSADLMYTAHTLSEARRELSILAQRQIDEALYYDPRRYTSYGIGFPPI